VVHWTSSDGPRVDEGRAAKRAPGLHTFLPCELAEEELMGILGWILFGLVVGALAKLVMPGRDPGGIIVTMLLGIAGAVLGGFVGRALGFYGEGEAAGFIMSFLGAVLLLALYRMMVGRRHRAIP
jgi:uncharacterized membrane protein YeaQ/YmgE (transglycosylase-associated protein family)